jgi:hypothetical protein
MSFVGKPHLSGSVLVWDGEKLISEKAIINLQNAYENANNIQLSDPVIFEGDPTVSDAKIEIIHTSGFEDDEGIRFITDPNAGATAWKPLAAYDKNELKVFEVETDTNASYVAVTSLIPDGNSGYQFMNELGTFMALDTSGLTTSLVFQKADDGYIDFTGDATGDPIFRINTAEKTLIANGIDITPRSGSLIIPATSTANHTILDLASNLSNDHYATFDINVFATTKDMPAYDYVAVGAWKFFVSMFKANDTITVAGITEYDHQHMTGSMAADDPTNWNVELNTNGILFVNADAPAYDLAFGAVITKLSVLHISTGNVVK